MIEVLFSNDQQEGTQSVVSQWLKKVGQHVLENEPLVEVSTDKVNVEIAAPGTGVLKEVLKNDGDSITPGDILALIEASDAASPSAATSTSSTKAPVSKPSCENQNDSSGHSPSDLSPVVKKLVKEHGLDVSVITGSGKGGRITHEDIMVFLETQQGASTKSHGKVGSSTPETSVRGQLVPHSAMRRQIAHHMTESLLRTAPHVTSVFEADLTNVMAHREQLKRTFEAQGIRLTFTSYFVRAAVHAIRIVPEVNSRFRDEGLEVFDEMNIGIATAIPPKDGGTVSTHAASGLIVPVLQRAQDLDLGQTAKQLQDLTEKARAGSLSQTEVRGGTFTISNHGVSGSLLAAPIIINQPQSAILGLGKLERRPVVVQQGGKETIEIRSRLYVTLTLDHRVLDGFKANAFLSAFVAALENPETL